MISAICFECFEPVCPWFYTHKCGGGGEQYGMARTEVYVTLIIMQQGVALVGYVYDERVGGCIVHIECVFNLVKTYYKFGNVNQQRGRVWFVVVMYTMGGICVEVESLACLCNVQFAALALCITPVEVVGTESVVARLLNFN